MPSDSEQQFEALLDYLKRSRGFDFTGYKRSSLARRIDKRMQTVGVATYPDYIDFLEVHPDEFAHLFNMILINVTAFFRDSQAWEYLTQETIPRILSARAPDGPVRVWSAGCASGQETYTLAMALVEAMGVDQFRERVKIYATDIDEEALAQARLATYNAREMAGVPPELVEKYFEQSANLYAFHKDLRRAAIFGRHDLLKDAPISRIDLLVCRNALMYFNAEMQTQVLARFHFALNDDGYLFLGKAEMLFTHGALFAPVDLKRRVFTKVLRGTQRERLLMAGLSNGGNGGGTYQSMSGIARARELVFEAGPVAQIVVDLDGALALANERARQMFRLSARDIGRPIQDLELSYRPVEVRSRIEQAYAERRPVEIKDVPWQTGAAEAAFLDVQIAPLLDESGTLLGVGVTFSDVTRYKSLQQELEESNRELETAYEELQSTNEELETTNEELQSTNEELQTINDELQTRSAELNSVNAFLGSILASLRGGVIVLDRDLHVQVWNHRSEDQWGLRADEVRGKHLLNLDIGLPAEELKAPVRSCLSGASPSEEVTLDATNRRGRAIRCRVTCTPLHGRAGEITGVILMTEEI
jgi:two-component system CheB/CheR fusion protein